MADPADLAGEVTHLLSRCRDGDAEAFDLLLPLVYEELRRIAAGCLLRERPDHTLDPTDLVHEAYVRLARVATLDLRDRAHFLAVGARAMRRILVEHARRQLAEKRVGAHRRRPLDEDLHGGGAPAAQEIVDLHEALEELAHRHPRRASLVEMRFFGGLSEDDAACAIGVSRATATRDWRFARLWIADYLGTPLSSSGAS